jgi:integrase
VKKVAKHPGLTLRGARWYARIQVPKDLWGVVGKVEIWRSMRTGLHRVAVSRFKNFQAEMAETFERARTRRRHGVSDAELRRLVRSWFADVDKRAADSDAAVFGRDLAHALSNVDEDIGMLVGGEDELVLPAVQKEADRLLARAGIKIDKTEERYHAVVDGVRRGMVEAARRSSHRLRGQPVAALDPEFAGAGAARMSVSDLVDDFMNEPRQKAVADKTRVERRRALGYLKRALGSETAITAVTRQDAREVREAMLPRSRPATINWKMGLYSSLFRHAVREHGLPTNVFEGLRVPETTRGADKRRSFTEAELERMVAAPPPEGIVRWALLLGLLNGFRLAEVTGLRPQDVVEVDGTVVIDVVPHVGRGLKTRSSTRRVPAHPLIARALLAHMEAAGDDPWPDLPQTNRPNIAAKRIGRYLRTTISEDRRLVGHSARHTFRDRMREGGVGRDGALQLGGWSGGTVADRYGSGMSPTALLRELRRVTYPVDLSSLARR